MKYFAKYLPVETDIRRGVQVPIFREGKLTFLQLDTSEKMLAFTNLEGYRNNTYKAAKLFLCSRDIQVGELVTDFHHPEPAEHEADNSCGSAGCFKVIGEISPAATWVTEGMEFEEDQVKRIYKFGTMKKGWENIRMKARSKFNRQIGIVRPHAPSFSSDTWEVLNPPAEDTVIEIKCPTCGTFH